MDEPSMSIDHSEPRQITTTVAFDGSQPARPVGHFSYDVGADRWSWGDGLYAMHGYSPREVPATTEVLLSHKHPDDRARAYGVLEQAVRDGEAFSCYHRVIDRDLRVRSVLSVGHGIKDSTGRVAQVEGFFVDLTQVRHDETQAEVSVALEAIAATRETIDLAKGIVMLALGCDADAAFQLLRRCSQDTNTKLHDVARQLVEVVGIGQAGSERLVRLLDGLKVGRGGAHATGR